MPAPRSTAKTAPVPSSKGPGGEQTALERENARARKREALERFIEVRAFANEDRPTRARLEIVAFVSHYGHALPLYRAVTSMAVSARL
jgi:hypothetical protein